MSHERRNDAARRIRGLYPPLPVLFAALRAALGATPADPLAEALAVAVADATTTDPDELALLLTVVAEDVVRAAARASALAVRDRGVPGDADVADDAVDAALTVLQSYAAAVLAGSAPPAGEVATRLRGVATSAGVVAAVRGTGWIARQRFGEPFCPRTGCYGRDGSLLTDERVAAEGLPPYGDGCNCTADISPAG